MTIEELIEELKKYDGKMQVKVYEFHEYSGEEHNDLADIRVLEDYILII